MLSILFTFFLAQTPFGDSDVTISDAVDSGMMEILEPLVLKGANVNAPRADGGLPLILAIENGHQDMAIFLLNHGADPNLRDGKGRSALVVARFLPVIKLLLEKGANIDAVEPLFKRTALINAAAAGDFSGVKFLVERGANVNLKDDKGRTAADNAAGPEQSEIAGFLGSREMKTGSVIDQMKRAAEVGDTHQISELLNRRQVGVNARLSGHGDTALIIAALNGRLKVVEMLLRQGADPNAKDYGGCGALIVAIKMSVDVKVLKSLLDHGADVTRGCFTGTPIDSAVGNVVANLLMDNMLDKGVGDPSYRLIAAIRRKNFVAATHLIDMGAMVDPPKSRRPLTSALVEAIRLRNFEWAERLIKKGASVNYNQNDYKETTALLVAAEMGELRLVKLLTDHGANISLRLRTEDEDDPPYNAAELAKVKGHPDVARFLESLQRHQLK